jgi:hypothetical protein
MTAFGYTLLGLAFVMIVAVWRMIEDDRQGLWRENQRLKRELEGRR